MLVSEAWVGGIWAQGTSQGQFCPFLSLWPREDYFLSLGLSFLNCGVGVSPLLSPSLVGLWEPGAPSLPAGMLP